MKYRNFFKWHFYTQATLQIADPDTQAKGDELHHKTGRLVVIGENDFSQAPSRRLRHHDYLLAEVEQP